MTVAVNQHYVAMRGTEHRPARCCALQGVVGEGVVCSIYAQRPQVCHEIMYTDYLGLREEKCDRARQAHGLPPLSPDHQPELDPPWPRSA